MNISHGSCTLARGDQRIDVVWVLYRILLLHFKVFLLGSPADAATSFRLLRDICLAVDFFAVNNVLLGSTDVLDHFGTLVFRPIIFKDDFVEVDTSIFLLDQPF